MHMFRNVLSILEALYNVLYKFKTYFTKWYLQNTIWNNTVEPIFKYIVKKLKKNVESKILQEISYFKALTNDSW